MKEFVTAVREIEEQDDLAVKIKTYVEEGMSLEEAEDKAASELGVVAFKVDGRTLHAYPPLPGQLAFMLASLGRGQTADGRFAAIINIMLSSLRDEDADYLESRLLSRGKDRLDMVTVEGIFQHITEEWFARPTQPSSDSAP